MGPDEHYLPDESNQAQAEVGMRELYDDWLRDEAAQAEYQSWLASIYRVNTNEPQQSD